LPGAQPLAGEPTPGGQLAEQLGGGRRLVQPDLVRELGRQAGHAEGREHETGWHAGGARHRVDGGELVATEERRLVEVPERGPELEAATGVDGAGGGDEAHAHARL